MTKLKLKVQRTKERLRMLRQTRQFVIYHLNNNEIEDLIDEVVDSIVDARRLRFEYHRLLQESHTSYMLHSETSLKYSQLQRDHRNLLATIRQNPDLCDFGEIPFMDNTFLPRSTLH